MTTKNAKIEKFKGLNNVSDPIRLGLGWLSRANDVNITDTGALVRRDGYVLHTAGTSITGAYTTNDFMRLYVVDAGALKRVGGATLRTGFTSAPMFWCEVNKDVYYTNGVNKGVIRLGDTVEDWDWPQPTEPVLAAISGALPAGQYQVACTFVSVPDGRETGASPIATIDLPAGSGLQITNIPQQAGMATQVYIAPANSRVLQHAFETSLVAYNWIAEPDALGQELVNANLFPIPDGTHATLWRGAIYVLEYFPASDITVMWCSEPLGFHLFDLREKYVVLRGKGTMLASHDDALIIGTSDFVYGWDGEKLTELADYGVVPGWAAAKDEDGQVYFWTERGVCRALPFTNMTERQISVAPGLQAGVAIVSKEGQKRFVVVLHRGGTAFNSHS